LIQKEGNIVGNKEVVKQLNNMMTNFQYSIQECDNFIDSLTEIEIKDMLKEMCRCWEHMN